MSRMYRHACHMWRKMIVVFNATRPFYRYVNVILRRISHGVPLHMMQLKHIFRRIYEDTSFHEDFASF